MASASGSGTKHAPVIFYGHGAGKPFREFSNFYPSDFKIEDITYWCMEQWIMAEKARLFGDSKTLTKILASKRAGAIKTLGRKVKSFVEVKWAAARPDVALTGLAAKFGQSKQLKELLLSTGDALIVEAAEDDAIWGVGLSVKDAKSASPETQDRWSKDGTNLLGRSLCMVREQIRASQPFTITVIGPRNGRGGDAQEYKANPSDTIESILGWARTNVYSCADAAHVGSYDAPALDGAQTVAGAGLSAGSILRVRPKLVAT